MFFFREIEINSCIFQHFFSEKACKGNLNKDFLHFSQAYFRKTIWSCVPVTIILPLFHSKNRKNEIFLEDLVEPADCLLVEVKVKSHFDFKTFSRHHTKFFNSFFFCKLLLKCNFQL